ncbi:MAG: hypothetical protein EOO43_26275, partial [Flavobacterium sp.]
MTIWQKVFTVLPKIKTPVQLSGLCISIVSIVIINVSSGGNLNAIICGGSIGIILMVYAQFFPAITHFPEKQRGSIFLISFVLVIIIIISLLLFAIKIVNSPTPSAKITLFSGKLPKDLDVDSNSYEGFVDVSEKLGHTLKYNSSTKNGTMVIEPYLKYLEWSNKEGPILPIWMQGYFFSVPTYSITLNNPTESPIVISSLDIIVKDNTALQESFITVSRLNYSTEIEFYEHGYGSFENCTLEYDVVPIPDNFKNIDPSWCCDSKIEDLLELPSL